MIRWRGAPLPSRCLDLSLKRNLSKNTKPFGTPLFESPSIRGSGIASSGQLNRIDVMNNRASHLSRLKGIGSASGQMWNFQGMYQLCTEATSSPSFVTAFTWLRKPIKAQPKGPMTGPRKQKDQLRQDRGLKSWTHSGQLKSKPAYENFQFQDWIWSFEENKREDKGLDPDDWLWISDKEKKMQASPRVEQLVLCIIWLHRCERPFPEILHVTAKGGGTRHHLQICKSIVIKKPVKDNQDPLLREHL